MRVIFKSTAKMTSNIDINFDSKPLTEQQKPSNPESFTSKRKKTHRSKKKLPGRKQRLRRKIQLQKLKFELAKEQPLSSGASFAAKSQGESVYAIVANIV